MIVITMAVVGSPARDRERAAELMTKSLMQMHGWVSKVDNVMTQNETEVRVILLEK